MNDPMIAFLEILKYTIPSLVVFATAYFTIKAFFRSQLQQQSLNLKVENRKISLQIRLQAYERLALFCERINPTNLLLRLHTKEMTNKELRVTLMISIQKEYEHNLVQQVYVSEKLWKIVMLAKDYVLKLVEDNYEENEKELPSGDLAEKILRAHSSLEINPVQSALKAVKKETGVILS